MNNTSGARPEPTLLRLTLLFVTTISEVCDAVTDGLRPLDNFLAHVRRELVGEVLSEVVEGVRVGQVLRASVSIGGLYRINLV